MVKWPAHPYVPGQSARHDEGFFDPITSKIVPGMTFEEMAVSDCWVQGWALFDAGYFWEAHELWEPLWMLMPLNSVEKHFVKAVIQLANARLKERMGRPKATLRLCKLAREAIHQARAVPVILEVSVADVLLRVEETERIAEMCIKVQNI